MIKSFINLSAGFTLGVYLANTYKKDIDKVIGQSNKSTPKSMDVYDYDANSPFYFTDRNYCRGNWCFYTIQHTENKKVPIWFNKGLLNYLIDKKCIDGKTHQYISMSGVKILKGCSEEFNSGILNTYIDSFMSAYFSIGYSSGM